MFTAAILEGLGLFMIVPFLNFFAGNSDSSLAKSISDGFAFVGLTSLEGQLIAVFFGFFLLIVLRSMLIWMREIRLTNLASTFVDHWRLRIFSAIAKTPWIVATGFERTDLEHAITNDIGRLSTGTDQLLRGSIKLLMLFVQLIVAMLIAPLLSILALGLIGLTSLLVFPLVRKAHHFGQTQTIAGRKAHRILGHFMAGLKLSKIHGAQKSYIDQFRYGMQNLRNQRLAFRSDQLKSSALFQICGAAAICVIILVGYLQLETPLASLVVVVLIMGRLTTVFTSLSHNIQASANMLPAFQTILETEELLSGQSAKQSSLAKTPSFTESVSSSPMKITLDDVSFRYEEQDGVMLDGVNLHIELWFFGGSWRRFRYWQDNTD